MQLAHQHLRVLTKEQTCQRLEIQPCIDEKVFVLPCSTGAGPSELAASCILRLSEPAVVGRAPSLLRFASIELELETLVWRGGLASVDLDDGGRDSGNEPIILPSSKALVPEGP
jgi:hypothetical protein